MIGLPGGGSPICDSISIPSLSSHKPFQEHIPLEIFLVVDEDLIGLWHNPDLPMSVSKSSRPANIPNIHLRHL